MKRNEVEILEILEMKKLKSFGNRHDQLEERIPGLESNVDVSDSLLSNTQKKQDTHDS